MRKHGKKRPGQVRKQRVSEIRLDFGRHQVLGGMNQSDDGTLTFYDEQGRKVDPVHVEVGSAYLRDKGPKVLARVHSGPAAIQADVNRGLSRFDFVFAVDTNTVHIAGVQVSLAVPHLLRNIAVNERTWSFDTVPQDAFEFHDATEPPERIAWWEIIQRVRSHPDVRRARVALVVDSDLGSLRDFNARHLQMVEGFLLPQ